MPFGVTNAFKVVVVVEHYLCFDLRYYVYALLKVTHGFSQGPGIYVTYFLCLFSAEIVQQPLILKSYCVSSFVNMFFVVVAVLLVLAHCSTDIESVSYFETHNKRVENRNIR